MYVHLRPSKILKEKDPGLRFFTDTLFVGSSRDILITKDNGERATQTFFVGFAMRDKWLQVYTP